MGLPVAPAEAATSLVVEPAPSGHPDTPFASSGGDGEPAAPLSEVGEMDDGGALDAAFPAHIAHWYATLFACSSVKQWPTLTAESFELALPYLSHHVTLGNLPDLPMDTFRQLCYVVAAVRRTAAQTRVDERAKTAAHLQQQVCTELTYRATLAEGGGALAVAQWLECVAAVLGVYEPRLDLAAAVKAFDIEAAAKLDGGNDEAGASASGGDAGGAAAAAGGGCGGKTSDRPFIRPPHRLMPLAITQERLAMCVARLLYQYGHDLEEAAGAGHAPPQPPPEPLAVPPPERAAGEAVGVNTPEDATSVAARDGAPQLLPHAAPEEGSHSAPTHQGLYHLLPAVLAFSHLTQSNRYHGRDWYEAGVQSLLNIVTSDAVLGRWAQGDGRATAADAHPPKLGGRPVRWNSATLGGVHSGALRHVLSGDESAEALSGSGSGASRIAPLPSPQHRLLLASALLHELSALGLHGDIAPTAFSAVDAAWTAAVVDGGLEALPQPLQLRVIHAVLRAHHLMRVACPALHLAVQPSLTSAAEGLLSAAIAHAASDAAESAARKRCAMLAATPVAPIPTPARWGGEDQNEVAKAAGQSAAVQEVSEPGRRLVWRRDILRTTFSPQYLPGGETLDDAAFLTIARSPEASRTADPVAAAGRVAAWRALCHSLHRLADILVLLRSNGGRCDDFASAIYRAATLLGRPDLAGGMDTARGSAAQVYARRTPSPRAAVRSVPHSGDLAMLRAAVTGLLFTTATHGFPVHLSRDDAKAFLLQAAADMDTSIGRAHDDVLEDTYASSLRLYAERLSANPHVRMMSHMLQALATASLQFDRFPLADVTVHSRRLLAATLPHLAGVDSSSWAAWLGIRADGSTSGGPVMPTFGQLHTFFLAGVATGALTPIGPARLWKSVSQPAPLGSRPSGLVELGTASAIDDDGLLPERFHASDTAEAESAGALASAHSIKAIPAALAGAGDDALLPSPVSQVILRAIDVRHGLHDVGKPTRLRSAVVPTASPSGRTRQLTFEVAQAWCAERGLPLPEQEYAVREVGVKVDIAWPAARIALECDGASHFLPAPTAEQAAEAASRWGKAWDPTAPHRAAHALPMVHGVSALTPSTIWFRGALQQRALEAAGWRVLRTTFLERWTRQVLEVAIRRYLDKVLEGQTLLQRHDGPTTQRLA